MIDIWLTCTVSMVAICELVGNCIYSLVSCAVGCSIFALFFFWKFQLADFIVYENAFSCRTGKYLYQHLPPTGDAGIWLWLMSPGSPRFIDYVNIIWIWILFKWLDVSKIYLADFFQGCGIYRLIPASPVGGRCWYKYLPVRQLKALS